MEMALKSIPNLSLNQPVRDDDQVDQLHNYVTVYLLVLSALIVGVKELAGQPLDCWVTAEKWGHFQKHANSYCWANGLYAYPNASNLSQMPYSIEPAGQADEIDESFVEPLNSYRWITVIIVVQAILFKLPDLIWSECNRHSGTNLQKIVALLQDAALRKPEARKSDLNIVAAFLETWLRINGRNENLKSGFMKDLAWGFEVNWKNKFLSTMYVVVKTCYLLNLLFQFLFLSLFLEFNFWHYGRRLIMTSTDYMDGKFFPLAALCHFDVKGQGQWVQCLLLMNILLEKIFIVQWIWFLVLLVITIFSIIAWIPKIFRQETGLRFIKRFMQVSTKGQNFNQKGRGTVRHFVCHYLGQDGIFLLRMISINTGTVVMAELMSSLFDRYIEDQTDTGTTGESPGTGTGNGGGYSDSDDKIGKEIRARHKVNQSSGNKLADGDSMEMEELNRDHV